MRHNATTLQLEIPKFAYHMFRDLALMDRNTTSQYQFVLSDKYGFRNIASKVKLLRGALHSNLPDDSSTFSGKFGGTIYSMPFNDASVRSHLLAAEVFLGNLESILEDENLVVVTCIAKLNECLQLLKTNRSFEREPAASLLSSFHNSERRPFGARRFRKWKDNIMVGPSDTTDYNLQFIVTSIVFVGSVSVSSHGYSADLTGPGLDEDCFVFHFDSLSELLFNMFLAYLGSPMEGDLSLNTRDAGHSKARMRAAPRSDVLPSKFGNGVRRLSTMGSTTAMRLPPYLAKLVRSGVTVDVLLRLVDDLAEEQKTLIRSRMEKESVRSE